jgi:hypothetical protein
VSAELHGPPWGFRRRIYASPLQKHRNPEDDT